MNLFTNIRKWSRKNFPPIDPNTPAREIAEIETDRDLQKDLQQLMCDAHEEAISKFEPKAGEWEKSVGIDDKEHRLLIFLQRLAGINKRMVSLQTVIAFENTKLTLWVIILTVVLSIQTCALIWFAWRADSSSSFDNDRPYRVEYFYPSDGEHYFHPYRHWR